MPKTVVIDCPPCCEEGPDSPCCPDVTLPDVIHATFANDPRFRPDCACLDDLVIPLTNGSHGSQSSWSIQGFAIPGCGTGCKLNVVFQCLSTTPPKYSLRVDCISCGNSGNAQCGGAQLIISNYDCFPLLAHFDHMMFSGNNNCGAPVCCPGVFNVTITT